MIIHFTVVTLTTLALIFYPDGPSSRHKELPTTIIDCTPFLNRLMIAIIYIPCYHISMILSFKDTGVEDVFNGINSSAARRTCPENLWKIY